MKNFFKKSYFPYIVLAILMTIVSCIIFYPALSADTVLNSPDSPTELGPFAKSHVLYSFYNFSPATFSFDTLWKVLINPIHYSDIGYIIITVLVALSAYHYLRVLKLDKMAAAFGAVAMTLSGYHFTLFSAGHRGYLIMMPYVILCFAIVEQILAYGYKCKWYHFVIIAAGAAAGLTYQPDIFLLFAGTLVVYAIARLCTIATRTGWKAYFAKNGLHFALSIVALIVFFGIIGTPAVRNIFENTLAGREEQLEQSQIATAQASDSATESEPVDSNWIFATGWSLPPDELIELAVPSPYGFDTGNQKAPYIGELGRPHDWKPNSNMFGNYRQHNLYVGMIQVGIALFAVILCFALFSKISEAKQEAADLPNQSPDYQGVGLVWFAIIIGAMILSLGRFTPIYALFYKLPVMDMIRCPVKFIHILELGMAVLVGFGIDALLKHKDDDKRATLVGGISMLLLIYIAGFCFIKSSNTDAISNRLSEAFNSNPYYIKHFLPISLAQYKEAFRSAAWLAICGSVVIGLLTIKNPIVNNKLARYVVCGILLLVVIFDMTKQATNFVHTSKINTITNDSVFLEAAKTKLGDKLEEGGAYSYLGLQTILPQLDDFKCLENKGLYSADPFSTSNPKEKSVIAFQDSPAFAGATARNGLPKRWPLMGTQLYILTFNQAQAFMNTGMFDFIGCYNFNPQAQSFTPVNPTTEAIYFLALNDIPCGLGVYYNYSTIASETKPLDAMANRTFDIYKSVVISGTTNQLSNTSTKAPTPAKWVVKPSDTEYCSATIEATCEEENGILYIRHNYFFNRNLQATVDGKPVEMYTANAFYKAIPLTKGTHTIELNQVTPLSNKLYIFVIAIITLTGFGCYIVDSIRKEKKETLCRSKPRLRRRDSPQQQ